MDKKIKITHAASAGILIDIEETSLGIDLFSKDPAGLYPDTTDELKEKLWEKIGRGEIQTLLFTHGHGDHFHLPDVMEAMQRNPELTVISTEEVIGRIRRCWKKTGVANLEAAASIDTPNLLAITSDIKENQKLNLPGMELELFNSKHMGAQYAGVQNLAVLLSAAGKRIFVPGDAWPETELFERVSQWSPEIDVMAAPFPLVGIPTTRRLIDKTLKIQNILAMHLPRMEKDEQNWLASAKAVCARAKDSLPMPVFGEVLGQEYYF